MYLRYQRVSDVGLPRYVAICYTAYSHLQYLVFRRGCEMRNTTNRESSHHKKLHVRY